MIRTATASIVVLLAAAPFAGSHAQAPVPGDELRVTTKMDMGGMAMPANTTTVCMPRDQKGGTGPVDTPANCQVMDLSTSGSTTRFRMRCTGEMEGEMSGETTTTPKGYRTRMTMSMDGRTMVTTQEAEKTGKECDAAEMERKMNAVMARAEADTVKMMAEACARNAAEVTQVPTFFGREASCKSAADVKTLCSNVRTPKGYYRLYEPQTARTAGNEPAGVKGVESACGVTGPGLKRELCTAAEGKGWWNYLAGECPAEAKVVAARECAGRDFTALQGSKFAGFCGAMATGSPALASEDDALSGGRPVPVAGSTPAGQPPGDPATDEQNVAEKAAEKARRGFKSLRDKVGF